MKYQVNFCTKTWYLHIRKWQCYLHMWKDHHCYGYTINWAFHSKKPWKWQGLVFHWCLYNKQNITWLLRDTKFLFLCWKIFNLLAALTREIFFNTQRETSFLCAAVCTCNILYSCQSSTTEFSFEWSHHRISSTDSEINQNESHPLMSEMSQSSSECCHAIFYC